MKMLRRICSEHIQPREHALGHADYTAPTLKHELGYTGQETFLPCLADLDHGRGNR